MTLKSLIIVFLWSITAQAEDYVKDFAYARAKSRPTFFASDYYGLGYTRNFPTLKTQEKLRAQSASYMMDYRYFLSDNWSLSIFGVLKHFVYDPPINSQLLAIGPTLNPTKEQSLYYACFGQESDYVTRIYHPVYAMVGLRGFFMVPLRIRSAPMDNTPKEEAQIGAGFVVSLVYFTSKSLAFRLYIDRWRGTASNKLHGFEVGFGPLLSLEP